MDEWRGQICPLAYGWAITYRIWKSSSKFKMKASVYLWSNLPDCYGLAEFEDVTFFYNLVISSMLELCCHP